MKEPVVLLIAALLALLITSVIPSAVLAQSTPPGSPDTQWQPPDDGSPIDPPVGVETVNPGQQGAPLLKVQQGSPVPLPAPVMPGVTASITNAYLVNSYGQLLNTLYRGELCYLILSVNGPGYLYIWEYYPTGALDGHWLCYRWYRPGAGVWKLGPFAAQATDPEGQYYWKIWYLSGTSWSTRVLSFNYTRAYSPYVLPQTVPVTVPNPGPVIIPSPAPSPQPVYRPAVVNAFTANPSMVEAGQAVTLTWTTTDATSVTISPGIGAVGVSGSTMVAPTATTTYSLSATGRTGSPATSSVVVKVNARIAPVFSADLTSVRAGQPAILTWNAPGATQVSISGLGSFGPTGSTEVEPEATTTYTLTAFYHDGTTKQESVAVTVEQAPLLLYGLLALLAVAAAIIVILLIRRYRHGSEPPGPLPREPITVSAEIIAPAETAPATTSVISAVAARLTLPDGSEIVLAGNNRDFGRHDFEKFLPQEKLTCISRQHFNITYEDNQYFIEDRASTNGTRVNGIEIRGAGRRALEDNDDLEIATRLHVKFSKNVSKEVNQ